MESGLQRCSKDFIMLRDRIIKWHIKLRENNSKVMQMKRKYKANIMYFMDSGLVVTVQVSDLEITDQWKHILTVK